MNYTYSDGAGLNESSGSTISKSPLSSVVNGLELEYTYSPVHTLEDEGSDIDLPSYLSKALVYYVKAKMAEDAMNIEVKEYMMREFRKMVEKHESSKMAGPRRIMPGSHAIR